MCFHNPSPNTSLQLFLIYGSTEGFRCMCGPLCRTLSLVTMAGFTKNIFHADVLQLIYALYTSAAGLQPWVHSEIPWVEKPGACADRRQAYEWARSFRGFSWAGAAWITVWISPRDVHRSGCHPPRVLQKHILKITERQMTLGARLDYESQTLVLMPDGRS